MLLEQAATEFVEFTILETPGIEFDVEGIALEVDACSSMMDLKKMCLNGLKWIWKYLVRENEELSAKASEWRDTIQIEQ